MGWYRSGFASCLPVSMVCEWLCKAVYEGFEEVAMRLVWHRTMQDSAVLLGHDELVFSYAFHRPRIERGEKLLVR